MSISRGEFDRLSSVMRPSVPWRWVRTLKGASVFWYAKKFMSPISKGLASGKAVAVMVLRITRRSSLIVVLCRGGRVGAVAVCTKWIAMELLSIHVLLSRTGVSFAVAATWVIQSGVESIAVVRRVPRVVSVSSAICSHSVSCCFVMRPSCSVISAGRDWSFLGGI